MKGKDAGKKKGSAKRSKKGSSAASEPTVPGAFGDRPAPKPSAKA